MCRCLELYHLLDPLPESGVKAWATAEPGGSLRTILRTILRTLLRTDITDVSCISLHTLRARGATAAGNAGINDRLFKRHGRWLGENYIDGYLKDNFQSLLPVSKSLRI